MSSLNLVQKNWLQGCLQRLSKGHLLDNILQAQEKKAVHFTGVGLVDIPAPDPSNNIRIDAKGADVVFEVKDGVYSISINASEPVQDASASVPETKSSVNWYEIIKIVLLAALAVNVLWKPRKETTKC